MDSGNFWLEKKVLVTGATGFIGGWLVKDLLARKAEVTCLVRDEVPRSIFFEEGIARDCTVVRGSLEDTLLAERVLAEYETDLVFHLGAQTQVTIANNYPLSTFESNLRGTYSLLDAVRRIGKKTGVIVASSDKAYGTQEKLPYTEETPLNGINPYDASKSCVDLIARSYALTYGMPIAISRCGNFYGGGDLNFNRLVPGTIRSAHCGKRPVIRSDGKFIRDYIYVADASSAYLVLGEKLASLAPGSAFNFSNEVPKTVLEIVETILRLMKSDIKPLVQNEAINEIRDQRLDSSKARKVLGWKAQYGLEAGLKETIDWYLEFFKRHG